MFNLLFPDMVVVGNANFGTFGASVISSFWITFFVWSLWEYMIVRNVKFDTDEFFYSYACFLNVFGVWLISRYSEYSGLGVVNFGWVVVLGLASTIVQKLLLESFLQKKN